MEDVLNRDTNTPVVPDKGQGKDGKDEQVTLSKSEVESLRRERDEARQSEKYWAGLARNSGGGRQADRAEEEDKTDASEFMDEEEAEGIDGDTPEKLVDEFASQGVKALAKRGFVTTADAKRIAVEAALKVSQTLISRERGKITSDAQLMTKFPDLKDQDSELFKLTAKHYQEAVAMDPGAKKTPAALFQAAKIAELELKANAPATRRRSDDDDYEPEGESDRRRRADSQDSRPRGRGQAADRDDMLGDEARQIISAMGITEDEFKASQKDTTGGRGRRR